MVNGSKILYCIHANLMSHSTENSLESPHLGESKRIAKNRGVLSSLVCHDYMCMAVLGRNCFGCITSVRVGCVAQMHEYLIHHQGCLRTYLDDVHHHNLSYGIRLYILKRQQNFTSTYLALYYSMDFFQSSCTYCSTDYMLNAWCVRRSPTAS